MSNSEQHQDRHNRLRIRMEGVALAIVAVGTLLAWLTLLAIRDSVDAMDAQIDADRNALWLDQRPWLGVSNAEVLGGFELGGKPTIRLSIVNSGKTPALNVKLFESVFLGLTVRDNDIRKWERPTEFFPSIHHRSEVAFPDGTLHQDISWDIRLDEETFPKYANSELDMNVWSRIEYCSQDQSFHWTETAFSKTFAHDKILFRRSSVSDHPGAKDHPNCQDSEGEK